MERVDLAGLSTQGSAACLREGVHLLAVIKCSNECVPAPPPGKRVTWSVCVSGGGGGRRRRKRRRQWDLCDGQLSEYRGGFEEATTGDYAETGTCGAVQHAIHTAVNELQS